MAELTEKIENYQIYFDGHSRTLRTFNRGYLLSQFKDTIFSFKQGDILVPGLGKARLELYKRIRNLIIEKNSKIYFDLETILEPGIWLVKKVKVPNIETVVKSKFTGSPKYDFINIYSTKSKDEVCLTEGGKHKPYVRFDWRNPLPEKDRTLPEGLAEFFINIKNAKKTALSIFEILSNYFVQFDLELNDICLFLDCSGTMVTGEISTDDTTWTYIWQDESIKELFLQKQKITALKKTNYLISLLKDYEY